MKRKKGLRRASPRAVKYADELDEITPALVARAGGLCERCGARWGTHRHHKLRRGQGGKNELANLLLLCEPCHDHIHANPEESYAQGYLQRRGQSSSLP